MNTVIAIITHSFLDKETGTSLAVGGVETWVLEMVRVLHKSGIEIKVYQPSVNKFTVDFEGAQVNGTGTTDRKKMIRMSHSDIDRNKIERIIYASSFVSERLMRPGQLFVQHGIHWDYTTSAKNPFSRFYWEYIRRRLWVNDFKMCRKSKLTIAVDTNFINFARSMMRHRFDASKIVYVPNFANPQPPESWKAKWTGNVPLKIVFVRRFEHRRGVELFTSIAEKLGKQLPESQITFAGCGSFENQLKEKFRGSQNILVTEVPHNKIHELLNESHLAVIPSIYSEGTSLSCLEAMASGCVVVATDVGGLTNIVIPGFNGYLVRPIEKDISDAIRVLDADRKRASEMAERGYQLLSQSFTSEIWHHRILSALTDAEFLKVNNNFHSVND